MPRINFKFTINGNTSEEEYIDPIRDLYNRFLASLAAYPEYHLDRATFEYHSTETIPPPVVPPIPGGG